MQCPPTHPPIPTSTLRPPRIDARRDCKHFHGRTLELDGLLETADDLPAPLVAVTGAPGAGKTSLLAEFRKRLPEHIARVKLEPEYFRSDKSLMFQIHQSLPCIDQFKRIVPRILAHVMDVGATTIAQAGGADVQIKAFNELRELNHVQSDDETKPLRLLSAAFPSGYVVTLDEAQNLAQYDDLPLARAFLHAMHENPNNENRPFGKGWMLLAGLNNVAGILSKFGWYRISHTYSLSALREEEARAVLMDHVAEFLPQLSLPHRERVEREWVPELAARYCVWPHHMQGAATSLAHVVAHGHISNKGFETILFYADKHTQALYQGIAQRIADASLERLSKHIAFLAQRNHGVITSTMVGELIRRVEEEASREEIARIAMKLQEIGLLQFEAEIPETGVPFVHYRIPIPSMLAWMTEFRKLGKKDRAISDEVQREHGEEVEALFAHSPTTS